MLMGALPLAALIPSIEPHSAPSINALDRRRRSEDRAFLESLKQDVANHPNDFITFETETGAGRFVEEHLAEARREIQPRIVSRGIFGYWREKTLVVLPILATTARR
jgi:hypothetical protein